MRIATIAAALALSACSTIETMGGQTITASSDAPCNVRVYGTYQQAVKAGPIEELCVISGTSAPGWSNTVAAAVEKHKSKVCACGGEAAYIQSRSGTVFSAASVTMVAFKRQK